MSKREIALINFKVAGYHQDGKLFTQTFIENRISYNAAHEAWKQGIRARDDGIKCTCRKCNEAV